MCWCDVRVPSLRIALADKKQLFHAHIHALTCIQYTHVHTQTNMPAYKQLLMSDDVYSPKMKGANWLKLMCHPGRSLVNIFSLWNIIVWYKSVVLNIIWLHSLVCQIHTKQMSQQVAYGGNICVVSCDEGRQVDRATLSQRKMCAQNIQFFQDC